MNTSGMLSWRSHHVLQGQAAGVRHADIQYGTADFAVLTVGEKILCVGVADGTNALRRDQ